MVTAKELEQLTGGRISSWRWYELARERRVPHRRLGRQVLFPLAKLAAFLSGDVDLEEPTANGAAAPTVKATKVERRSKAG
jgi:hypothetical protein